MFASQGDSLVYGQLPHEFCNHPTPRCQVESSLENRRLGGILVYQAQETSLLRTNHVVFLITPSRKQELPATGRSVVTYVLRKAIITFTRVLPAKYFAIFRCLYLLAFPSVFFPGKCSGSLSHLICRGRQEDIQLWLKPHRINLVSFHPLLAVTSKSQVKAEENFGKDQAHLCIRQSNNALACRMKYRDGQNLRSANTISRPKGERVDSVQTITRESGVPKKAFRMELVGQLEVLLASVHG